MRLCHKHFPLTNSFPPYRVGTATVTILERVNMRRTEDKNLDLHLGGREVAEMQSEVVCPPEAVALTIRLHCLYRAKGWIQVNSKDEHCLSSQLPIFLKDAGGNSDILNTVGHLKE